MSGLTALFVPASIAVLGVSRNPAKLGYRLLQNVKEGGFGGAIHPVNPSGESILGLPTVTSIDALPDGVDLALVSLPAPAVPEAIKALAARRVRAAVILSSGFGEVDDDGRATQRDLLVTAGAAGLRLVGPNCMGVYSAPAGLNGTYFWDLPRAPGSHTGSLAGAWEVYRAACASAGVVLAEETEEFFDAIETLVAIPVRRPAAPSVAVITVSGGPSVIAADTAEREGLAVPALG